MLQVMRYTIDEQRRYAFRDWLRSELQRLDFYQRRGNRYLVSEFWRYAESLGARVEEVSLGRYLREENPVLPTPESCRELAKALGLHPAIVLLEAGYLSPEDFNFLPSTVATSQEDLQKQVQEVNGYSYLPEAIRAQMINSLQHQMKTLATVGSGEVGTPPVPPKGQVASTKQDISAMDTVDLDEKKPSDKKPAQRSSQQSPARN
jgi:hypothetical protein